VSLECHQVAGPVDRFVAVVIAIAFTARAIPRLLGASHLGGRTP
jgi:hypothetical protein